MALDRTSDTPAGASLLPTKPSFAGHQTFPLRSGWLKKGLDALQAESTGGARTFTRPDALITLGVGKNMVDAIRYWLCATRMAEEAPGTRDRSLLPTQLGRWVFGESCSDGLDPYLEDDATVWLLHWNLVGPGSHLFAWVWAFSHCRDYEFTRSGLTDAVRGAAVARLSRKPAPETVGRDIDCLLHTYVAASGPKASDDALDCPLTSLGLIRPAYGHTYRFCIGPKANLPAGVFAYALLEYWRWFRPAAEALPVHDLLYGEGSPGVVFKLDEDSVLAHLDALQRASVGQLRFDDSAQGRQVVRESDADLDSLAALKAHYNG